MNNPRLLSLREVLARVCVSQSTWYSGMKAGTAPRPIRIGSSNVAWKAADIEKYVAKRGPLAADWRGIMRPVRQPRQRSAT